MLDHVPQSLEDALEALSSLERESRVQASRELREVIVARWPDSPEASQIAEQLETRRNRGRAAIAASRYRRAVQRAQSETARRQASLDDDRPRQKRRAAAAARNIAETANVGEARRRATEAKSSGEVLAAVEFARRAVEIREDAASLALLDGCFRAAAMYADALAAYRKAWSLDERAQPVLRTGAAAVLADVGDLAGAKEVLEPVLKASPRDAYALNAMGRIDRLLGDLDDAAVSLLAAARDSRTRVSARLPSCDG